MKESDNKIIQTQISDLLQQLSDQQNQIDLINTNPLLVNQPNPVTPPSNTPQASNLLRNGSFSYDYPSWFNTSPSGDARYECYGWHSHPDKSGQAMYLNSVTSGLLGFPFTDTDVNTGADTITITAHTFITGNGVTFTSSSPPNPLVTNTVYWVIVIDANTVKLATTRANSLVGTAINLTTAGGAVTDTLSFDYTLKSSSNTMFDPVFSTWNRSGTEAGTASINQGFTLDAYLDGPDAYAQPSYSLYGVFNIAKSSIYVTAPTNARIGCGLYAKQSGTWGYLTAPYTVTAQVRDPVATPTSRDYLVHVKTNRGFTVNTSVLTVASAPSDTDFTNGAGVVLNWSKALNYGVLSYAIYRKTGANYVLLFTITNGTTSYIDNNTQQPDVIASFPTADFTGLFTYSNTIPGVLTNLATAGVSPNWDTIPFALLVPAGYNVGTTDLSLKQWVRWNITGLNANQWDISVTDATLSADGLTLTSASGQFLASMAGLTIDLFGAGGATYTGTVATYSSATVITITPAATGIFVGVNVSADTGTQSAIGNYSARGTVGGKPFYNLVGQPTDSETSSIDWESGQWLIWDGGGNIIYVSADAVATPDLVTTWATADGILPLPTVTKYTIPLTTIEGGAGESVVFVDLAQLSYGANALFSFNAQDLNGLHGIPPVAPNGSSQGGTGVIFPIFGDGGPTCVWGDETVQVIRGFERISEKAINVKRGEVFIDRDGRLNHVEQITYSLADVYKVTTENGFVAHTTNTHKYHTPELSGGGLVLKALKIGDEVITCRDGENENSKIMSIDPMGKQTVVQFNLAPKHGFLIGTGDYKVWGGISSNNLKPIHHVGGNTN